MLFVFVDFMWRTASYCLFVRAWGYSYDAIFATFAVLAGVEYIGMPRASDKLKSFREVFMLIKSLLTPFTGAVHLLSETSKDNWPQTLVVFWLRYGLNILMSSWGIHRSDWLWDHKDNSSSRITVSGWEGNHHGWWIALTVLASIFTIPLLQLVSYWVKMGTGDQIVEKIIVNDSDGTEERKALVTG